VSIPFKLIVSRNCYDAMIAHAKAALPNECCGLLAGTIVRDGSAVEIPTGKVAKAYPLVNELASPREYLSDARSMLAAEKDMRRHKLEVLAVYHSHPTTHPVPSVKDCERNYSPNVVNVIISLRKENVETRAWWLTETAYSEAEWEIVDAVQNVS
jgi:[CysO sulfur-carrier protein]-S-L-cysteine hydrolase